VQLKGDVCMKRLKGKTTVITGGGSGIGLSASKRFAAEGASVIVLEVDDSSGKKVEREIIDSGGACRFIQTDISDVSSVAAAFAIIQKDYAKIDVLYNNASVFLGKLDGPVDTLDFMTFEKIVKINLYGLFACSHYAIPLMKKEGGSIINTASSAAVIGIPNCDAYTASKGATVALTRSFAVEFGPFGIRTNCIAPAAIMTPMVYESNLNDPNFDEKKFLSTGTPLRRWGTPDDIASVALFLASDESSYLNGAIITADGGITIS